MPRRVIEFLSLIWTQAEFGGKVRFHGFIRKEHVAGALEFGVYGISEAAGVGAKKRRSHATAGRRTTWPFSELRCEI